MYILVLIGLFTCALASQRLTENGVGIINGKSVSIKNYPFMASLKLDGYTVGAGAILNENCILSGAMGMAGMNVSAFEYRVGTDYSYKGGQALGVSNITFHPRWRGVYDYNVAVVRVNTSITFGDSVQSIAVAAKQLPVGTTATVAGWGEYAVNGSYTSSWLETANATVQSEADCRKTFHRYVTKRTLCTYDPNSNPCMGDTGAPLVWQGEVYGVYAGGLSCEPGRYPFIYTSVPPLRSWINKAVRNTCH